MQHLADKYHVGCITLREWINQYQIHGISAFITGNGNKKYSKELKIQCEEALLSGEGSVDDIMFKYGISSGSISRKWIMKYNPVFDSL